MTAPMDAKTIEACAKICEEMAEQWIASVREGSEQAGYEDTKLREAAAAIRALPPSDCVSVPREPTPEMVLAAMSVHRKWENGEGDFTSGYWQAIYKAMLAAKEAK